MTKKLRTTELINGLIADIKTKTFPVDRIIMFGSAAKGKHGAKSDLDLCIVKDEDLSDRQKYELQSYFRERLNDEMDVDFVYCSNEKLKNGGLVFKNIRNEGLVLYGDL